MREIKFRAPIKMEDGKYALVIFDLKIFINPLFTVRELILPFLNNGGIPDRYTGLKDENEKEIYEGDIVKQINVRRLGESYEFIGIVEYDGTGFSLKCLKGGANINEHYAFSYYGGEKLKKGEVIGNIYENQELLKINKD